ncbi:18030_t:CDS:2, partial [Funneliformis geosporum]
PEETSLPTFKTRLVNILSNTLKSTLKFRIKHISTFSLQVREVGISTASDDLNPTYYYRKVACEKKLPLLSWAVLSNYLYKYKGNASANIYSFQVSVNNYNPI